MSLSEWFFAIAGILGAASILVLTRGRKVRSQFPFFFKYLIAYILILCVDVAAFFYSCALFNYVDSALTTVMVGLEFLVMYEVLVHTLQSYSALTDLAKVMFRWAAAFLLLTALVTALATNGGQVSKLQAALTAVEHTVRIMQCGLLLFLLVFETHLGIHWRNHGVSIALGMGVYSAVNLIISYLQMIPSASSIALERIDGGVYFGVLAFWGCTLMLPEPKLKTMLDSPSKLIFQRWNESLGAATLARRTTGPALYPVQSFLPGVEQTVERVMARKMMH